MRGDEADEVVLVGVGGVARQTVDAGADGDAAHGLQCGFDAGEVDLVAADHEGQGPGVGGGSTGVAAVPTLSEWALVLMASLLALAAVRGYRGRP